jgi:hypothetical protein
VSLLVFSTLRLLLACHGFFTHFASQGFFTERYELMLSFFVFLSKEVTLPTYSPGQSLPSTSKVASPTHITPTWHWPMSTYTQAHINHECSLSCEFVQTLTMPSQSSSSLDSSSAESLTAVNKIRHNKKKKKRKKTKKMKKKQK